METFQPLGSLIEYLITLKSKRSFFIVKWSFKSFSLYPLPVVLSLGTTRRSGQTVLTIVPTSCLIQAFNTHQKVPSQSAAFWLNNHSPFSSSSYVRCLSLCIIFVCHGCTYSWMLISLILGHPELKVLNCTLKWTFWKCNCSVQTNSKSWALNNENGPLTYINVVQL